MSSTAFQQARSEIKYIMRDCKLDESLVQLIDDQLAHVQQHVHSTVRGRLPRCLAELQRTTIDLNSLEARVPTLCTNSNTGDTLPEGLVDNTICNLEDEVDEFDDQIANLQSQIEIAEVAVRRAVESGWVIDLQESLGQLDGLRADLEKAKFDRERAEYVRAGWENCEFEEREVPEDLFGYVMYESCWTIDQKLAHRLGFVLLEVQDCPWCTAIEGDCVMAGHGWGISWSEKIAAYMILRFSGCPREYAGYFDTPQRFYEFRDSVGDEIARECVEALGMTNDLKAAGYFEYKKEQFA